jgi:hypothetical protein
MDYRYLGTSGFKVPVLGLGTGTFGGVGPLFSAWGNTDVDAARRLIDICLDAGLCSTPLMCIPKESQRRFSVEQSREDAIA